MSDEPSIISQSFMHSEILLLLSLTTKRFVVLAQWFNGWAVTVF